MRTFKANELKNLDPGLLEKIKEGYDIVVPTIAKHVGQTLQGSGIGDTALHSSFLRIEEEDTKEIFYTELQILFIKFGAGSALHTLWQVVLHDSLEEYEAERKRIHEESVRNYGNENFPVVTHYHGKEIKRKP